MAIDFVGLVVQIVVATVILAPVLWIAGRMLAGKDKAKFTDALWIALLGTVIGGVVGALGWGLGGSIIMFVVWLGLIKHFFDCGWLRSWWSRASAQADPPSAEILVDESLGL